jgi:plasmid stabilization system protein ParE
MTRRFNIQDEAVDEANVAFNWHEDQQAGLGDEFYRELTRCIEFIVENPLLSRVVYLGLRKRKLDRFPYLVYYSVTDAELSVVSVFHGSRNPIEWKKHGIKRK